MCCMFVQTLPIGLEEVKKGRFHVRDNAGVSGGRGVAALCEKQIKDEGFIVG